jgi:hypothetical protein
LKYKKINALNGQDSSKIPKLEGQSIGFENLFENNLKNKNPSHVAVVNKLAPK